MCSPYTWVARGVPLLLRSGSSDASTMNLVIGPLEDLPAKTQNRVKLMEAE